MPGHRLPLRVTSGNSERRPRFRGRPRRGGSCRAQLRRPGARNPLGFQFASATLRGGRGPWSARRHLSFGGGAIRRTGARSGGARRERNLLTILSSSEWEARRPEPTARLEGCVRGEECFRKTLELVLTAILSAWKTRVAGWSPWAGPDALAAQLGEVACRLEPALPRRPRAMARGGTAVPPRRTEMRRRASFLERS